MIFLSSHLPVSSLFHSSCFLFYGCTCSIWKFPGWGQIGVAAAGLRHSHSNARSEPCLQPNCSSWQRWILIFLIYFILFLVFCLFRAAYGGSQTRGRIGAVASSPHHTTAVQDPSCICNLHHSSKQRQILNPLSGARDWTWVRYC